MFTKGPEGMLMSPSAGVSGTGKDSLRLFGHEEPTPEEIQLQGIATIARVKEFFEGIDTATPGLYKNGMLDIRVVDWPFTGYRIVRAEVNGFAQKRAIKKTG